MFTLRVTCLNRIYDYKFESQYGADFVARRMITSDDDISSAVVYDSETGELYYIWDRKGA